MSQIAELFVNLGVKGSDKTIEAFTKVKSGISGIASTSIEAKAAILGAVYALQQFTSGAAKDGAHIQNLAEYLDISTKSLQAWTYAAQQGNISSQELESSLSSIQDKIKEYNVTRKLPEGSTVFAQQTGFDFNKPFKADELLENLLKFSQNKNYSKEVIEKILQNWGLTPNEIGSAFSGKFKIPNLKNTPFYSDKEIENLSKVNVLWDNLETKVKMFFGHFTAKNGEEIVKDISDLTDKVLKLALAFEVLLEKLKVFKLLGEATSGWTKIFNSISENKNSYDQKVIDKIFPTIEKESTKSIDSFLPSIIDNIGSHAINLKNSIFEDILNRKLYMNPQLEESSDFKDILNNIFNFLPSNQQGIIAPPLPYNQNYQNQSQNLTVNQNLNFQHEGREIIPLRNDLSTAVIQAMRMSTANTRST